MVAMSEMCHCGKPLHYTNPVMQGVVTELIEATGPYITVTVAGRTWLVQRHYIALHGLTAAEVASLGFREIMPLSKFQTGLLDAMYWGSKLRLVRDKDNLLTDCRLADGTCVPLRLAICA